MTTPATAQLPRPGHISRWLHDSDTAVHRAADALRTARTLLRDAAAQDHTLKALSAEIETLSTSLESIAVRISAESSAERYRIEAHRAETKALFDAATRRMFALVKEIDHAKAVLAARIRHDENRIAELREKGLTAEEIAKVHKPMSSDEAEIYHAQIRALQAEKEACARFVGDGPRFDVELLRGTSVYPQPPAEAA